MIMNLVFLASKGIQESYFLLFKLRKALWKASPWTESYQDISVTSQILRVRFSKSGHMYINYKLQTSLIVI